jgi:hypothetical protein
VLAPQVTCVVISSSLGVSGLLKPGCLSFVTPCCLLDRARASQKAIHQFVLQLPNSSSSHSPREGTHTEGIRDQHAHRTSIRGIHRPHRQVHHASRYVRLQNHPHTLAYLRPKWERRIRTRRKIASEFRLIASSKAGAGIGLGPATVVIVPGGTLDA